jgi:hypothetical protein
MSTYDDLLEAELFVLGGFGVDDPEADETGQEGELTLVAWEWDDGEPVVPVFTSAELLEETAPDEPYVGILGRDLLAITRGADLVVDPGTETALELPAVEVERLLDGVGEPS